MTLFPKCIHHQNAASAFNAWILSLLADKVSGVFLVI